MAVTKVLLIFAVAALAWSQAQECVCPLSLEYVCGADGITYDNTCLMQCVGVEKAYDGPCVAPPECVCPFIYDPVCSVKDRQTYANSCEAECYGVKYYKGACRPIGRPQRK